MKYQLFMILKKYLPDQIVIMKHPGGYYCSAPNSSATHSKFPVSKTRWVFNGLGWTEKGPPCTFSKNVHSSLESHIKEEIGFKISNSICDSGQPLIWIVPVFLFFSFLALFFLWQLFTAFAGYWFIRNLGKWFSIRPRGYTDECFKIPGPWGTCILPHNLFHKRMQ